MSYYVPSFQHIISAHFLLGFGGHGSKHANQGDQSIKVFQEASSTAQEEISSQLFLSLGMLLRIVLVTC